MQWRLLLEMPTPVGFGYWGYCKPVLLLTFPVYRGAVIPVCAINKTADTRPLLLPRTFHGALSGRENVAFVARIYGAAIRATIGYVEGFSELGEYFEMPVNTYSAGMRARLAFATCLAIDFDIYLIDEVTEIGDQRFRRRCAEAFRQRMLRSDIILVTHNPHTIRQYCDRGAVLAGGRLTMHDDIGAALESYYRLLQESA
jgi:capsular polysaccharide transport system ATP-binding protein